MDAKQQAKALSDQRLKHVDMSGRGAGLFSLHKRGAIWAAPEASREFQKSAAARR
jgi:hypothetical protein